MGANKRLIGAPQPPSRRVTAKKKSLTLSQYCDIFPLGWERNRMPATTVVFFREEDGSCPLLVWLDRLPPRVQDKCIVRIERLAEMGYELRRPEADFLRDGIYELRVRFQSVNYRMLYFFSRQTAVISHGLTKEKQIPDQEIELAIRHRELFEKDPAKYTYEEPDNE
jgi:phage-related protein